MILTVYLFPLGLQVHPRWTPKSGTFFPEALVMEVFLRPFFLFHWFKNSTCQLMAKEYTLSTGKLPLGVMPSNNVDITSAVYRGCKAKIKQTNIFHLSRIMRKQTFCICENKDADQLCGNRETDQRLCFRNTDSSIPLLPKYGISSL